MYGIFLDCCGVNVYFRIVNPYDDLFITGWGEIMSNMKALAERQGERNDALLKDTHFLGE